MSVKVKESRDGCGIFEQKLQVAALLYSNRAKVSTVHLEHRKLFSFIFEHQSTIAKEEKTNVQKLRK